jgi:F0F1-type ATP synthase assembly protein I
MGAGRNTPPFGYPNAIESLRQDLRDHAARDESELATIRDDVKDLIAATAKQDVVLGEIKSGINHRKRTEESTTNYSRKRRIAILSLAGTIIGVVGAIIGALLHHYLP